MEHQWVEGCEDKCGACNLCCLSICKICGLYEGALTTECPGVHVPEQVSDLIYAGEMDFKGGRWVYTPSDHSPAAWRIVGYCKECGSVVFVKDKIDNHEIYECPRCGHPRSLEELWPDKQHCIK